MATGQLFGFIEFDFDFTRVTFQDVLDPNQGYIKEDKVVLEIQVKAETPKNMM